ncbi:MAG: DUF3971 domain-containing protein [Gammaproteobacteria bacterium]|nr:DUF3971 domain-containing protein [Gammaproteobacteria bacterium]
MLALAAAGLQTLGRVGAWLLDDFEGALNAYLGEGVTVSGLRGDWQGLNPVVRAARVELPAGSMERVLIELDWPETLLRSRWIMQRLFVERADLEIVRNGNGWGLAGPTREAQGIDWLGLINYTDEIRFRGRISVAGDPHSALDVEVLGFNRDGLHGFDIRAADSSCGRDRDCAARLQWRHWPHRWSPPPAQRYLSLQGKMSLPLAYLGLPNLGEALAIGAAGQWTERNGVGGGEFALEAKQLHGDGNPSSGASLEARLAVATRDGIHHAVVPKARLKTEESAWDLRPVHARGGEGHVQAWIDELSLAELGGFLTSALPEDSGTASWIMGADARGILRNVHLAYGAESAAYSATFDGLRTASHRGLPMLRDASGALIGHQRGLLATLNSESMQVHFADTFDSPWRLKNVQGQFQIWFQGGYFGLRSPLLRVDVPDGRLAGTLALSRPPGYFDQRFALALTLDRLTIPADPYIPRTLPEDLKRWLHEGPRKGQLAGLKVAYQGQVHTQPDDYSRRAAISGRLSGGEVRFQSDWPLVTLAQGAVEVSGESVFAHLDSAASVGLEFRESHVHVGRNGAFAELDLQAQTSPDGAFDYIRASPLAQWMTFVEPDWGGAGDLELSGRFFVPLVEARAGAPLTAEVEFGFAGSSLNLPNYRLAVADLVGDLSYQYPYGLSSLPMAASLFGRPATVTASAEDGLINFAISGDATERDVYRLADMADLGVASGRFRFDAIVSLPTDDRVPSLTVATPLEGVAIDLPGEFGKTADDPRNTRTHLRFLDDFIAMDVEHGPVEGWLHIDEAPLRGALGVRRPPPLVPLTADEVVITGDTWEVDVQEWSGGAEAFEFPAPWRLVRFETGQLTIEATPFKRVAISGTYRDGATSLAFDGKDLKGRLEDAGEGPLKLHFERIILPPDEAEPEGEEEDPLDVAIIDQLPEADVQIDSLHFGEEDFGRWSFEIRHRPDGVLFDNLDAQVKDTAISAPDGVFWHRHDDRSEAEAHLVMADLKEVLPQWDYEPSLRSESAELHVDASWPGSPLNVTINGLTGKAYFRATNGHFIDVEGGAGTRIFSLLNINTIFKRMNFDFKDVTGEGVSFDTLKADTKLNAGTLEFVEPAKMKGSGSDFKMGGSINLIDGIMNDNEMIVTLPVSDSLPWYAVYVSLANPVAGLAVLAGQQALKKPIKQLSTAKYEISGSWDDPDVKFVGIWNDKMQAYQQAQDQAAEEGGR